MNLEELAEMATAASIWKPATVTAEPHTWLTQWQVYSIEFAVGGRTIHFVGWAGYEGRVSSSILEYDGATKRGVSRSGRIYELSGPSGHNADARHVFGQWLEMYYNPDYIEKTDEYESI